MQDERKTVFVIAGLTIAILVVFWQACGFDFVNYDDYEYVTQNEHISTGLTPENIIWVFTSAHGSNWHPLTGLSHIIDCQLFGLNPGWHHLINVIFHVTNTLLLVFILKRMTGAFWQSAFVAAVFGLHPAHVESVAWISERKDVLSTLFFLLTIASYVRFVKLRSTGWYLLTVLLFALGLMAKPMLVTLPFVLLLLDYWPLNRVETGPAVKTRWQNFYPLFLEKIPLFILSAVSSVVTVLVQKETGALADVELIPLTNRIANAVISYGAYIGKLFWPTKLAVFYPYPRSIQPWWQILAVAALLLIVTIAVIRLGRKYKYLPTGWFWYLGTLVPVIGLVQVGAQSMADRYTYIPFTGLFIILAWGTNDLLLKWKYRQTVFVCLSSAVIFILTILALLQTAYWCDSINLLSQAVRVTNGNYIAYNNRGLAYHDNHELDLAIDDYNRCLEIHPFHYKAYYNLGNVYYDKGEYDFAVAAYNSAVEINPLYAKAYNNRGNAWHSKGQIDLAIADYAKAAEINPQLVDAYFNKAFACEQIGRNEEAIEAYKVFLQYATPNRAAQLELAKQKIKQLKQKTVGPQGNQK